MQVPGGHLFLNLRFVMLSGSLEALWESDKSYGPFAQ